MYPCKNSWLCDLRLKKSRVCAILGANALAGYAQQVVYLNDRQICQLDGESWVIRNQDMDTVDVPLQDIAHYLGDFDSDVNVSPSGPLTVSVTDSAGVSNRH